MDDPSQLDEDIMSGALDKPRDVGAYVRSLSERARRIACRLNSVPSVVRVGFVAGAEIAEILVRRPWEIVPTGIGDLLAASNLS